MTEDPKGPKVPCVAEAEDALQAAGQPLGPAPVVGMAATPSGDGYWLAPDPSGFAWPIKGAVTSVFGRDGARRHDGIDIDGDTGDPIGAAKGGVVVSASFENGYGRTTVIDHGGGVATVYAHESGFAVSPGTRVVRGQVIGYVGSSGRTTGAHLHFEVRINGTARDPLGFLPS